MHRKTGNRNRALGFCGLLLVGSVALWCDAARAAAAPGGRGANKEKEIPIPAIKQACLTGPTAERAQNVLKLGQIKEKEQVREHRIKEFLLDLIKGKGNPRLRRTGVEALVTLARNTDTTIKGEILGDLTKFLKSGSESPLVQRKVAQEMPALVDPQGFGVHDEAVRALMTMATSAKTSYLKKAALVSLGKIARLDSFAIIRKMLSDRDEEIQTAAYEAFDAWVRTNGADKIPKREQAAVAKIIIKRINDPNLPPKLRQKAIMIAAQMKNTTAIPQIESLLRNMKIDTEEDEELLLTAIESLSYFGKPSTVPTLIKVYKDFNEKDDVRIRKMVCGTLGEFYEHMAKSSLAGSAAGTVTKLLVDALYDDKSAGVIATAAFSLGNIPTKLPKKIAIEALIEALDDSDDSVRKNCKLSLEDLTFHSISERREEKAEDYKRRWQDWWKKAKSKFR